MSSKNSNSQQKYFVVQLADKGSKMLLENEKSVYRHIDWETTPKDSDHGNVGVGDILFVYFTFNSIKYKQSLQKTYRVLYVSEDHSLFELEEVLDLGIPFREIKQARNDKRLRYEAFCGIGQQGYNIKEIQEEDYNQLMKLFFNYKGGKLETLYNKKLKMLLV